MDPPKREQTSLTDSYGRSANEETLCECVSFVACVSVHENKNAYGACGCVSLHLHLWSETYDPVDCRCSRHPAVFILCRLRLQLKHFLPSLLVRVKFILLSRLEGSTICKSIMGNKILCSMLTVTLIIMCLFFQVAAVSGNKGLAELIANFTERDIGTLMLLWESKVSSWWFHHCVKQFLRVQLNCSFSGVDFGRVA